MTIDICSAIHTTEKVDPFEGLDLELSNLPRQLSPGDTSESLFALNPLNEINLADIALDIAALSSKSKIGDSQKNVQVPNQDSLANIDTEAMAIDIHSLSPVMVKEEKASSLIERESPLLDTIDLESMARDIHLLAPIYDEEESLLAPLDDELSQLEEIDLEGMAVDIHSISPTQGTDSLQQSVEIDLEAMAMDIHSLAPKQCDDYSFETPLNKEFSRLSDIDLEGIAVDILAFSPIQSEESLLQSAEIDLEAMAMDIDSLAPGHCADNSLQTPLDKEFSQLAEIDLEGMAVDIHLLSSTENEEFTQQTALQKNQQQSGEIDIKSMTVAIDAMLEGQYGGNRKYDDKTASEEMVAGDLDEVSRALVSLPGNHFFAGTDQQKEQPGGQGYLPSTDISHPPAVQRHTLVDPLIEKASHYMELARLQEKISEGLKNNRGNTLLIAGPHDGMGSSVLVAALAVNAARSQRKKVLLVDFNMRRPDLHSFFFLSQSNGFTDIVRNNLPWQSVLKDTGLEGLGIITAGTTTDSLSKDLLYSHIPNLMKEIKPHYDLILFDTSPVLKPNRNNVNITSLTSVTDYFVLVLTQSGITKKQLQETQSFIEAGNGKIDSIIINEHAAPSKPRLPFHTPLTLLKQAHVKMLEFSVVEMRKLLN